MKHFLIGILFFGFCAFKPALPNTHQQYVKPMVLPFQILIEGEDIIQLQKALETTEVLPALELETQPPKWKVIVDDVVVMLRDKSQDGYDLAMSHYMEKTTKIPFPG